MAIHIRDDWYYSVFMYSAGTCPTSGHPCDIMGIIYKETLNLGDKTKPWTFQWRIRFHNDDHAFQSADKKEWFTFTFDGDKSEIELNEHVQSWMASTSCSMGAELNWIPITGNGSILYEKALKDKPWAHAKKFVTDDPENVLNTKEIVGLNLKDDGLKDAPSNPISESWMS